MSALKSYSWKPIQAWSGDWVDEHFSEAIQGICGYIDEASWKEFNDRAAREWSIESGQIEGAFDLTEGITIQLIQHGFSASLVGAQRNGRTEEEVHQILLDLKDGLEGIFDFIKSDNILTISYIRQLHQMLMRSVDTYDGYFRDPNSGEIRIARQELKKGAFKDLPNNPSREDGSVHEFCPPLEVPQQMEELIRIHKAMEDACLPAIVRAAWLHHAFTQIHPFQDGNGRVARALASLVLLKAGMVPLTVHRQMRGRYVTALRTADEGEPEGLIDCFRSCIYRLMVSLWHNAKQKDQIKVEPTQPLGEIITSIRSNFASKRGLTPLSWRRSTEALERAKSVTHQHVSEVLMNLFKSFAQEGITLQGSTGYSEYSREKLSVCVWERWGQEAIELSSGSIATIVGSLSLDRPVKILIGFDRFHPMRHGVWSAVAAIQIEEEIEVVAPAFFSHFESVNVDENFRLWLDSSIKRWLVRWQEKAL